MRNKRDKKRQHSGSSFGVFLGLLKRPYPKLGQMGLLKTPIGDYCFKYVGNVTIAGLKKLESVVIGKNSFTKHKNSHSNDPNHRFYLKNCSKLKSLKMGRYSFSDYSVCEIESVDALEAIAMGDLNEWSYCFYHASLELKSVLLH